MAYLRIHCDVCGGTWEVYHRDNWKDDKARQCPHCFSKIDRQTWENQIIPAFAAVHDANAELYKDSTGYHAPLFTFDVIANHLYKNRQTTGRGTCKDTCPLTEMLNDFEAFLCE